MVCPGPGRARIAGRGIGAVGVVVEEDAEVIALGIPVIYIADGIIDLRAGLDVVSGAGEEGIVRLRPTKHPRRGSRETRQIQRPEEKGSGCHRRKRQQVSPAANGDARLLKGAIVARSRAVKFVFPPLGAALVRIPTS